MIRDGDAETVAKMVAAGATELRRVAGKVGPVMAMNPAELDAGIEVLRGLHYPGRMGDMTGRCVFCKGAFPCTTVQVVNALAGREVIPVPVVRERF